MLNLQKRKNKEFAKSKKKMQKNKLAAFRVATLQSRLAVFTKCMLVRSSFFNQNTVISCQFELKYRIHVFFDTVKERTHLMLHNFNSFFFLVLKRSNTLRMSVCVLHIMAYRIRFVFWFYNWIRKPAFLILNCILLDFFFMDKKIVERIKNKIWIILSFF